MSHSDATDLNRLVQYLRLTRIYMEKKRARGLYRENALREPKAGIVESSEEIENG